MMAPSLCKKRLTCCKPKTAKAKTKARIPTKTRTKTKTKKFVFILVWNPANVNNLSKQALVSFTFHYC